MKKHGHSTALVAMCAGAFCLVSAHAQSDRVYVGANAGGVLTDSTRVKEFFGPVSAGTKVRLDPGVRVGFVGGYKLTDWFAVEGETGVTANRISSIRGGDIDGDASLANIPFLLNARLQLPRHGRCPVTPYIGGGVGGAASLISTEK